MKHWTHYLLIGAIAYGFFATLSVDGAQAGWFYGKGCYRPSYSSYSYSCYRPAYRYTSYCAPAVYRTTWSNPFYSSCYSNPGYYGTFGGYRNGGFGGFGEYTPLTNYGTYGAIHCGYTVPVSYGYSGW